MDGWAEENEEVGVKLNAGVARTGVLAKGGAGERSVDSLLGEALNEGVADTRFLIMFL